MIKGKLVKYDVYRDSEVEFTLDIPSYWETIRIKDVIYCIDQGWSPNAENRTVVKNEWGILKLSAINNGIYYEWKHKTLPHSEIPKPKYLVKQGDFLLTRSNTPMLVGDCCLVSVEPVLKLMYSDLIYCLDINRRKFVDRYLNYFLVSTSFRWVKTISARGLNDSMVKISQRVIRGWKIFSPPINEQNEIANYLDTQIAKIDCKIELLTQKATMYNKLKQSLIKKTVTRGLDKIVVMKDSGVEWIGEVPEQWEVLRLKDIVGNFETGKLDVNAYDADGKYPFFTCSKTPTTINTYAFDKEVLLITGNGDVGNVTYFSGKFNAYQRTYIVSQFKRVNVRFLKVFIESLLVKALEEQKKGSVIEFIKLNHLRNFVVVLPLKQEQQDIVDYLDTKTTHIDRIIETINTQIDKLKELRKTLINDVVTGKIKVYQEGETI